MGSGKTLPKLLKLCYKVSWGGKITTTQPSTISLSVNRSKEYSFTLFHHVFKENHFWGGSCVGIFGTFGPKGAMGSQNNVVEVANVSEEIWRFLKKFCEPTLSNLLPPARLFSYLATRWRSSTNVSCNTLLVSPLAKVLKVYKCKSYFSYPSW